MSLKLLLFTLVVVLGIMNAKAGSMFILDDGELEHHRYRRDLPVAPPIKRPLEYLPIPAVAEDLERAGSSSYHHGGYKQGKVGPVYTFVKTDPYAHVKWGVRHVVGKKYAGH